MIVRERLRLVRLGTVGVAECSAASWRWPNLMRVLAESVGRMRTATVTRLGGSPPTSPTMPSPTSSCRSSRSTRRGRPAAAAAALRAGGAAPLAAALAPCLPRTLIGDGERARDAIRLEQRGQLLDGVSLVGMENTKSSAPTATWGET